jgi:hypothetical protein
VVIVAGPPESKPESKGAVTDAPGCWLMAVMRLAGDQTHPVVTALSVCAGRT